MAITMSVTALKKSTTLNRNRNKINNMKTEKLTTTSTTTTSAMNMNNTFTSLVMLSGVWLALCASLVHKHLELIAVFFAFAGSFLLAALLTITKTFLFNNTNNDSKSNSSNDGISNSRIRNIVGLVACTVALMVLTGSAWTSSWTWTWTTQTGHGPEYSALSIAAGYLAFDHWFSAMYCSPQHHQKRGQRRLWQVIEDALTLTVLLTVLATLGDGDGLADYHQHIWAWVAYKTLRLTWQTLTGPWQPLDADAEQQCIEQQQSKHQEPQKRHQLLQSVSDDSSQSTVESESSGSASTSSTLDDNINSTDTNTNTETWIIHGEEYRLQDYVARHPGGLEAIMLGRGRDCTALFESYHPFTNKHKVVLEKYRVAVSSQTSQSKQQNKYNGSNHDHFYEVLCQRVALALRGKGIDPKQDRCATPFRILYYGLVLVALVMSGISHVQGSIAGSFLFAVFGWLVGAMGHDAGHFAASRYPVVNDWAVWGMSLLCNPIMWQHQHTYAHHSNTNEFDHDPDLHHFHTFLRVHRRFQQQSIYKHQSNLAFVVFSYMFVVFGTCFWIPLGMIQENTLYGCVEWSDRKRPWRAVGMYTHMIAYVGTIMILPFWTHASSLSALAAVILHVATSGLIFAFFSQINHLNEASLDTEERRRQQKSRDSRLANSWAVDQVETSNNFAPGSTLWHFLSNGLNYQIEHHLFPGLNHCHLHHIAPVVRATCEEYGVCYKSYKTWSDTMQAALDWLDKLSIEPELTTTVAKLSIEPELESKKTVAKGQ